MMFLIPLLVVVMLVVAFGTTDRPVERSSAAVILDRRLAEGQIEPDEHRRRLEVLGEQPIGVRRRDGRWLVVAGVLLLAALAMGMGSGWGNGWFGGHMGWSTAQGSAADPVEGASTFEVVATDLAFAPTTLTAEAGVAFNLVLVNEGRVFHDLSVPEFAFMLDADPGQRVSGSLVIDEPGTYEFACSVPGHARAGMRGTLVVTARGVGAAATVESDGLSTP